MDENYVTVPLDLQLEATGQPLLLTVWTLLCISSSNPCSSTLRCLQSVTWNWPFATMPAKYPPPTTTSVVHGPARLKSPGSGSAFKGSGLDKIKAEPSVGAQARLGPAQSSGRGLGESAGKGG